MHVFVRMFYSRAFVAGARRHIGFPYTASGSPC